MVVLRPPAPADRDALLATRDEQFHRFMGEGSPDPRPAFCITVDDDVVGWVDVDRDERAWLTHDEVNIGYGLAPRARGRGLATRAVMLTLHHLSLHTDVQTATLLIDADNRSSLGIPARCGFDDAGTRGDHGARFFRKRVPPITYTDGVVTIRVPTADDAERHLEATDDAQLHWLWEEAHRDEWATMSRDAQLEHQRRFLARTRGEWGPGPKWWFAIDVAGRYVGHVDCDLANPHVPHGEANVSYSIHPGVRGRGYGSRAVRLVVRFATEHTGAREAHLVVHPHNAPSLRVARAVGAVEVGRADMVRHVLGLR